MCGIAGVARIDGGPLGEGAGQLLERMADIVAHRGPDAREILLDGPVGMAFNRLSLVDPSASGGQPLVSDDGSIVLIANGEIYNHRELAASLPPGIRLTGGSDCEVVLYLYRQYGLSFLDRVRGMFGLILWDRRQDRLLLARDRFGIKPLYFHRDRTRIVMASEIKTLFADPATPRQLDWSKAVASPLMPAVPEMTDIPLNTWFEGIESVQAGTILSIDLNGGATREHRYWTFPGDGADAATADEFISQYRELLIDSVRECATADAELGLFLSGGIDSAAVAAIAAEQGTEVHTFTVLNAGTYHSGDAEHAHRLTTKLGLPNHQVLFEKDRIPDAAEWRRLLWLVENPLCGPEIYYKHELHRYAKATRPELRGMLLGAASDEFNGGYSNGVVTDGGGWGVFDHNLRDMARGAALCDSPELRGWWAYGEYPLFTDELIRQHRGADLRDPYPIYLACEYNKIQQYNVWHEDRTAAGSGIEARVPFLDHRLVELVTAVPTHLRPALLWDKAILRTAMRGILPDETVNRPKGPFFYGSGLHHVYRMLLRMLTRDGEALIEEAVAAPGADAFIDASGLRQTVRQLQERSTGAAQVEIALRVVNLGLLAGMTNDIPETTARTPIGPAPQSIEISDWSAQEGEVTRAVGLSPRISTSAVAQLAENVLLLNDPREALTWYLAVDGSIEYELDASTPGLVGVLRSLDGARSLDEVLTELGCDLNEVYQPLVDLLDDNLVQLN